MPGSYAELKAGMDLKKKKKKKGAGMHSLALPNWLTRHSPFKKPSSQTYEIIKTLLIENAALMESYGLLKAPVIYIVG
jgi:hypothetical protein